MKDVKKLLEFRNARKKKKPNFLRQDAHKVKRLKKHWRSSKGLDSKMRRGLGSYRKEPSPGYGSPKLVRGLTRAGLREVLVFNVHDLSKITKDDIVVISGNIGTRKKIEILKKIKELKLKVKNFKDVDGFLKKIEEKEAQKKKEKETKKEKKKKAKEEALKKAETKKKEAETKEEKEEAEEKKEKDVLLHEKIEKKHEPKETKEAKRNPRPQKIEGNVR